MTPIRAIKAMIARTRIRTMPRRRVDAGAKLVESISSVLPDSSTSCRASGGRACRGRGRGRSSRGSARGDGVGRGRVGQSKEATDDVERGAGTDGVLGGRGRAEGAPRVVEEMVAEPRHGSRDRRSVPMAQLGASGKEAVEFTTQRGLRAAPKLTDQPRGEATARWPRVSDRRRVQTLFDGRDDRTGTHGDGISCRS